MEERFFKFSLLSRFPELIHGVSGRGYGEMKFGARVADGVVIKNRQLFLNDLGLTLEDIVVPRQVHSSKIMVVGKHEKGQGAKEPTSILIGTDGLITTESNVYLAILTADCLPVFFYDPVSQLIGIAHAGWRGIIDQIIPKMLDQFKSLGSVPENLIIGIGPGICQKHFVVKKDVLKYFLPLYSSATFVRNNDGYIDLKKTVMIDLKKAFVNNHNIETMPFCTVCDNGIFPSFRKEGSGTLQMMSVIGIKNANK